MEEFLKEKFYKHFDKSISPLHLAEAPGRVNLIGEHIDYNGYSVLPMALNQRVFILFHYTKGNSGIHLHNVDNQFGSYVSDENSIVIDQTNPKWFHYFMCAYQGIIDYANDKNLEVPKFNLQALFYGTIPPGAGLSSSSALVVCSALVVAACCGFDISKVELAQLCAKCERYIGTQGGGMDQAISLLAQEGNALHIVFNEPLDTELVPLPSDVSVVVAHCGAEMHKAASNQFNQRVVECRLAAKLLMFLLAREGDNWCKVQRLQDVQRHSLVNKGNPSEMHVIVEELLHTEPYTREELMELWQISTIEEFQKSFLTENTKSMTKFKLRQRADHVFTEAFRVHEFLRISKNASAAHGNAGDNRQWDASVALGHIMSASHKSCSEWYECSSDELDRLVKVCMDAGALGSRLTGAGWGGCAIALVKTDNISNFLQYVQKNYYTDIPSNKVTQMLFVSKPAGGAKLIQNIH